MAKKHSTTSKRPAPKSTGARASAKKASSSKSRHSVAAARPRSSARSSASRRRTSPKPARPAGRISKPSPKLTTRADGKPGAKLASKAAALQIKSAGKTAKGGPSTPNGAVKGKAVRNAGSAAPGPDAKTAKVARSGSRRPSGSAATPQQRVADADGYIYLNGRRVRMISTKGLPVKKSRSRTQAAAAAAAAEAAAKPVKTKLSRKELNHYRDLLLIKRVQLVGDLSAMEAQALQSSGGDLSHMPIHMADIGTDTYDQDFMLSMAEGERERIREIDAALQRIADGTYGICQKTNNVIPKARLDAKPWARHTVEAARLYEQGRGA